MKYLSLLLTSIILISCSEHTTENQIDIKHSLNPIIGNESSSHLSEVEFAQLSDMEKIKMHLLYAEKVLRIASNSIPDENVKAKRLALLDILHTYAMNEEFPANEVYINQRRPCFIDGYGTYCAVGQLVKETGGVELAQEINDAFQYAYISEMKSDNLDEWIHNSGFSKTEIAMIQPTYSINKERTYNTVYAGMDFRNGFDNGWTFGYSRYEFNPIYGRGGAGHWKGYGANISLLNNSNYSIGLEYEKVWYGIKKINTYLLGGIAPKFVAYNNEYGSNVEPYLKASVRIPKIKKFVGHLEFKYGYDIPIINQDFFNLNRHLFSVQLKLGIMQGLNSPARF
jgi:hypothetical protein